MRNKLFLNICVFALLFPLGVYADTECRFHGEECYILTCALGDDFKYVRNDGFSGTITNQDKSNKPKLILYMEFKHGTSLLPGAGECVLERGTSKSFEKLSAFRATDRTALKIINKIFNTVPNNLPYPSEDDFFQLSVYFDDNEPLSYRVESWRNETFQTIIDGQ